MSAATCTTESHEELKRQPERWDELELLGNLETGPGDPVIELRNCRACHSTLGLERPAGESTTP